MLSIRKRSTSARSAIGLALCALMMLLAAPAAGAQGGSGPLVDLQPDTSEPTDGASGTVVVAPSPQGLTVSLSLTGLDTASAGTVVGSHVHVGPCIAGDGAAAGPHFNSTSTAATKTIGPHTEVWLDFTIGADGTASASSTVPFPIIDSAAQSVVIHAMPTDAGGGAGARWACLPVSFSNVAPAGSAAAEDPADTAALAFTGSETTSIALTGVGMTALGAGLVLMANRRRREN